ncbi:hypothetical protein MAJ_08794, partial [Metarhizium majus ARSEF 297]
MGLKALGNSAWRDTPKEVGDISRLLSWESASVIQKHILNIKNSCLPATTLFDPDSILDSQLVPLPPCVLRLPSPPSSSERPLPTPSPHQSPSSTMPPTKIAHCTPKFPGGGNYMPSQTSRHTTKSPRPLKRETSERVHNSNLANHNVNNIKDGVGSGNDSYTMY